MGGLIKKLGEITRNLIFACKQMRSMSIYCNTLLKENKKLNAFLNKQKRNNTGPIYITDTALEYLKDWLNFIEIQERKAGEDLTSIHDVMTFIEDIIDSNAVEIIHKDKDEENITN